MSFAIGRRLRGWALRISTNRVGVALVYHRVANRAGDPNHELLPALPVRLFEAHLRFLKATYRLVPPSALLEAAHARLPRERVPVAITFDDDLDSHLELARPLLLKMRIPAGFFLSGASIDEPTSFWWEVLQDIVDGAMSRPFRLRSLPGVELGPEIKAVPGAIHQIAETIEQLPPHARDAVAAELHSHVKHERRGLEASQIATLAGDGFEIGFHTRRHYLLLTVDDDALPAALTEGRAGLEALVQKPMKMIAYPHGRADRRVREAAATAGYEAGFTGMPLAVSPATDPLMIGRIEPALASVETLARTLHAVLRHARLEAA